MEPAAPGVARVVAYDFGIKRDIISQMTTRGFDVTVVPAETTAAAGLRPGRLRCVHGRLGASRDDVEGRFNPREAQGGACSQPAVPDIAVRHAQRRAIFVSSGIGPRTGQRVTDRKMP